MTLLQLLRGGPGQRWYKNITVDNAGGSAKTDWPIRVDLNALNFSWGLSTSNGRDVAIKAADGTTSYPFCIDSWDTAAQTAVLWFKIPSLSAGGTATARLYYGGMVGEAQQPASVFTFVDTMDEHGTIAGNLSSADGVYPVNKSTFPNPVVAKAAGTFKAVLREPSNIIDRGPTFVPLAQRCVVAYTGDNGAQAIGITFSPDGLNWTDFGQVIPNAEDPYFVKKLDDTLWTDAQGRAYCYFERKDGSNTLGLARTADFKVFEVWSSGSWTFVVANHTALLSPTPSSWEDAGLGSPCVVHDGTTFHMLYEGWTNTPSYVDQTGIMRSTDGISFTRSGSNPIVTDAGVDVVDDVQLIGSTWWGTWHATGGNQYRLKSTVTDPANWTLGSWVIDGQGPVDSGNSVHPYPKNSPLFGLAMFMPNQVGADTMDMFDFGGSPTWQLISLGAGSFHSNPYSAYIDIGAGKLSMGGVSGGATTMRTRGTPLPASGFAIHWVGRQTGAEQTVAFGSGDLWVATPFPALQSGYSIQDDGGVWKIRRYGTGGYEGDVVTLSRDVDMTVDRRCELRYRLGGQIEFVVDGVTKLSGTDATYAAGVKRLMVTQANSTRTVNFLAVRKFDGVDPTVSLSADIGIVAPESPHAGWGVLTAPPPQVVSLLRQAARDQESTLEWTGINCTPVLSTAQFKSGAQSVRAVADTAAETALRLKTPWVAVTPGVTYRLTGWCRFEQTRFPAWMLRFSDGAGNDFLGDFQANPTPTANTWTFITIDGLAPSGAALLWLQLASFGMSAGEGFNLDDVDVIAL